MKVIKRFFNIDPTERYILFTDGSYQPKNPDVLGVGAELRNKLGEVVFVYSEKIEINTLEPQISHNDCEKVALRNALMLCHNEGVKSIIVNTDSSGLSYKMNEYAEAFELDEQKRLLMHQEANFINNQLFDQIDLYDEFFIEFIPRNLNKNADFYSRATLEISHYGLDDKDEMPSIESIQDKIEKEKQLNIKIEPKKAKHDSGTSVKLLDIDKHLLMDKDKKLDKSLMIDIQDDIKSNTLSFRVFYEKKNERNTNEFQLIKVNYGKKNKGSILLFIIHNLVGENSNIELLKTRNKENKEFIYEYSDKDWLTFDNLIAARKYYKTLIYMNEKLLKFFNQNRRLGFDRAVHPFYFPSFHKTVYNSQLNYFLGVTHNQALLYISRQEINEANEKSRLKNLLDAQKMKVLSI